MRRYSTSQMFEKIYKKSPKMAFFALGIMLIFQGIVLLVIFENNLPNVLFLLYSMIVIGSLMTIATTIYTVVSWKKSKQNEELLNSAILSTGINQLDNLSPYEFEDWVARFLNLNGYQARTTKRSGDFGADVIAFRGNTKIVISCKKYVGNLGIKCVQEIIAAMDYYNANEGWVASTSPHFSKQAYDLARSRGVRLFTKNDLALMLNRLQQENQNMQK